LEKTNTDIFAAFCNDIDTPTVIGVVDETIKKVNTYLTSKFKKVTLLEKAYRILEKPFRVMGLEYTSGQK